MGQEPKAKTPTIDRVVHVLPDGADKQRVLAFFAKGLFASYDAWGHQNITGLGTEAYAMTIRNGLRLSAAASSRRSNGCITG